MTRSAIPTRAIARALDPLELSFTRAELLEAALLIWPARTAREVVPLLHRSGGSPDELLAALTLVSRSSKVLVGRIMRARWKERRKGFIAQERLAAANRRGLIPTKRQVLAQLRKRGITSDDPWLQRGFAYTTSNAQSPL